MIVVIILIALSFVWLLYETRWLTVRLPYRSRAVIVTIVFSTTRMQRAITSLMNIVKTDLTVYLAAITIAEVVTVFFMPLVGMVSHIIILAATIIHSSLTSEQTRQRILLALALVPLVRIISLSMALGNIPQIWWYPIIYAP